jgi:hypothetical protein
MDDTKVNPDPVLDPTTGKPVEAPIEETSTPVTEEEKPVTEETTENPVV